MDGLDSGNDKKAQLTQRERARQQCMYEGPLRTNVKSVKNLYSSAQDHSRPLLSVSIETRV